MTIYKVRYWHRHGDDEYFHLSEEGAKDTLASLATANSEEWGLGTPKTQQEALDLADQWEDLTGGHEGMGYHTVEVEK